MSTATPPAEPAQRGGEWLASWGPENPQTWEPIMTQKTALDALVHQHLEAARQAPAGRSAHTVVGGHEHMLRQTLIALLEGRELAEHENPGEATVHVLHGRVRLVAGPDSWEARKGDLLVVPPAPHRLEALADSAVLLTVAKLDHQRR
jgi:quercetin dioxygenase-like cupin family protein